MAWVLHRNGITPSMRLSKFILLGVAFHAAWSFVPYPVGAPVMNIEGGQEYGWFFFTSPHVPGCNCSS